MKILAIEKEIEGTNWKEATATLKAEAEAIYELIQKNIIREIYFDDLHNAVMILECKDKQEAKDILGRLPIVKHGLSIFKVSTLLPYSGLERLFEVRK
ncbi:MAG: hypothetical protein Q8S23_06540 [Bacteroidales bacterium]|jgi:hypothetical protein|nr:hypothetical protein [Bacteroidales bacterium]MDP3398788.1 hypothetical protein [Bacteroidales bacterium]